MSELVLNYTQSFFYFLEHVFLFLAIYPGHLRKKEPIRILWAILSSILGLFLSFLFITMRNFSDNNTIYAISNYMMYFFYGPALVIAMYLLFEGNLLTNIFYYGLVFCLRGAVIRIFTAISLASGLKDFSSWLDTIMSVAVFTVVIVLLFVFYSAKKKEYVAVDKKLCIYFIILFLLLNTLFGFLEVSQSVDELSFNIILKLTISLVYIFLIVYLINVLNITKEKVVAETAKNMLSLQEKQFESYRSSVDYLNVKCHDLKYQLRSLKNNQPIDEKLVEEIDTNIATYESYSNTDSQALNIILREKFIACVSKDIQFLSVIESNHISSLQDADCYSLFGNAIDNAIEYESKLPKEERMIRLKIKDMSDILFIHIENYIEEEKIELVNGLPKTTKDDAHYHGFGTQSMKMIADKYHGFFQITAENHLFSLNIGIPIKK